MKNKLSSEVSKIGVRPAICDSSVTLTEINLPVD
jgi:hypothetical protein